MNSRIVAIVLLVTTTGCSVLNPYVHAPFPEKGRPLDLARAVQYATDTRERYYSAIQEQTLFNRSTGLALLGVSAAALAIGASGGGGGDTVTALGIGGAGAFTAHQILYTPSRSRIYAEGAKAIGCVLAPFESLRSMDDVRLDESIRTLGRRVGALQRAIADVPPGTGDPEGILPRGKKTVAAGQSTLSRGAEGILLLRSAGPRLYESVEGVRSQVNTALLSQEPDIAQLVGSLSKVIPATAASITGPKVEAPAKTSTKEADLKGMGLRKVSAAIDAVVEAIDELESELLYIETASSHTPTQGACALDLVGSSLTFRLDPQVIVIDASAADVSAVAVAKGGKAPYFDRWSGQVPGTSVTLEPISHDPSAEGQGTVTINAKKGTPSGDYQIAVDDSGSGHATLTLHIVSSSGSGSGTGGGAVGGAAGGAGNAAATVDPNLQAAQQLLIKLHCLAEKNDKGATNADGVLGPDTKDAFSRLAAVTGDPPHPVEAGLSVAMLLQMVQAADKNGKACPAK